MYRSAHRRVKWLVLALLGLGSVLPAAGQDLGERLERSRALEESLARLTATLQAGQADAVLAEIDMLRDEIGTDARWANLEGLALAATGDHRAAVQRYTRGIAREPERAELHTNLAVSLVALGATGRALSEFEQATTLDPRSVDAYLGWGRELHRLGRDRLALEPLERARELAPADLRVLRLLGDVARGAGRDDLAREVWTRADAIAPDLVSARRLAEIVAATDPEAALAHYDRCVEMDPAATDCREAAASLELQAGRAARVVDRLRDHAGALSGVGLETLVYALWTTEGADGVLDLADRRLPETPVAWGLLALARREAGDKSGAQAAVEEGLALRPEDPGLLVLLGAVLDESGRRSAAREAWRRALAADPENAEARANLEATGGL